MRYPVNLDHPDGYFVSTGTFEVTNNDIDNLNNSFEPTLFQELIEKLYEIRVFYLNPKIYSMAIFSQTNSKTRLDYRNYDHKIPNRCVPVKLPELIIRKIKKFMKVSSLSTASIDIIFSKSKEYIFLEANPMGQLDWLSRNCNYHIEKDIANLLIEKAYGNQHA